jgi:Fe-S-cluster containining protein
MDTEPSDRAAGCSPQLARLLQEARSRSREIERFYVRLRSRRVPELDRRFREAHERAFRVVDCTRCGACCRSPGPRLNTADVGRLAAGLGLRPSAFAERYLRTDEDRDTVFSSLPCPFLAQDNLCSVYGSRPKACREYPHTDQKGMRGLLRITARNALLCPAVYLVTEELRRALGA